MCHGKSLTESHYHCDLKCSPGQYVGFFKVFSPTLDTPIPLHLLFTAHACFGMANSHIPLSLVLAKFLMAASEAEPRIGSDVGLPGPRGPWRDQVQEPCGPGSLGSTALSRSGVSLDVRLCCLYPPGAQQGFTGNVTNVRLCRLIQSHGLFIASICKMDFMPEIIHHSPTLSYFHPFSL